MPWACAASSASATCRAVSSASSSGSGPALDPLGEILPLNELHHQGVEAVDLLEPVNHAYMEMIERGEHAGFAFEARDVLAVLPERARENLDCDVASEPGIAGAIDLAHPAGAQQSLDFEDADATSREWRGHRHRAPGGECMLLRQSNG